MNVAKQAKINSTRHGSSGLIFADETTMPAEVWDYVPDQACREPHPAQRWEAPGHALRCYRETLEVSQPADTMPNPADDQRASVLMGVLLGLTMFVAVLISGDFGDSDWSSTHRIDGEFAFSNETVSA